ncbi:MAG TPA: DUF2752 domain-containing protein [Verrucomicrobiae bacterium]
MNAAPPKISRSNPNVWFAGIILAATVFGGAAVLFFFNPATHHFFPVCQFHRLTGLNCPGCGGTRAAYALLHGEFSTALRDNALFVGGLIFLALRGLWFAAAKSRRRSVVEFFPARCLWALLIIAVVFTVLRNVPAFAFLSP